MIGGIITSALKEVKVSHKNRLRYLELLPLPTVSLFPPLKIAYSWTTFCLSRTLTFRF